MDRRGAGQAGARRRHGLHHDRGFADAKARATDFSWDGNDEMDEACGHGWAELQPNDSIEGEISFHSGDEYEFAAVRWISSTAC